MRHIDLKIQGCLDCPFRRFDHEDRVDFCGHGDGHVDVPLDDKKLWEEKKRDYSPDWCPLPDVK